MTQTRQPPETVEPEKNEAGSFWTLARKNFWSLLLLCIVLAACLTIVQLMKKPGQMSVIESQSMDMTAMLPPKGALPVGIAKVERGEISSSVTYTGTVQAFNDDDIYPRLTGRIVQMPVYAGDRVKKGQLLVQLDPSGNSEYSAAREEAVFAEDSAQHNAGIAKSELNEKRYMLEAAKDAEESARKLAEQAEANLAYWKPELERQSSLLKAQVVSLDEYQKELAEMKAAQAKLEEAQARVREATNSRLAAQSALDTMVHHVGHQSSMEKEAGAALKKAGIQERYTKIVAPADGVITKRLISPGVVVNPGMLILKVAELNQVRIQAEVASEDAERIRLGDKVYIKGAENSAQEISASISSIFPAADPASRTLTVEALLDNLVSASQSGSSPGKVASLAQYRFLPGQYVIMRILTGAKEGLTVPTSAIIWREGKAQLWKVAVAGGSGQSQYTCLMHPEVISDKPGDCPKCGMHLVARNKGGKKEPQLVDLEIGLSNQDKTEILKGLAEGDEVVYAGYENLEPGMPVVAVDWGRDGPLKLPSAAEVQSKRLDASNNWTHEEMLGDLRLNVSLQPAKASNNFVVVKLEKNGGTAVTGALIEGSSSMPGMDMPGPGLNGRSGANGEARLKSDFMSGLWQVKLRISAPGEPPRQSTLDLEVP